MNSTPEGVPPAGDDAPTPGATPSGGADSGAPGAGMPGGGTAPGPTPPSTTPATPAKPARKPLPQPVLAALLVGGSFGGIIAVMAGMLVVLSPSSPAEPEPGGQVNVQGAGNVSYLSPTVGPGGPNVPLTAAAPTAPPPEPALTPIAPLALTPTVASASSSRKASASSRVKTASTKPLRIRIPAIGVSAPVGSVGVDKAGEIQSPPLSKPNYTGWYRYGPAPGDQGPAIILGHVNTRKGAAVFSRLRELKRGNKIAVQRADGKTAIFTVDGIEQVSKTKFPTKRVYGNTATASLRLITCGGVFNAKAHSYTDNIIVYATLTSTQGK